MLKTYSILGYQFINQIVQEVSWHELNNLIFLSCREKQIAQRLLIVSGHKSDQTRCSSCETTKAKMVPSRYLILSCLSHESYISHFNLFSCIRWIFVDDTNSCFQNAEQYFVLICDLRVAS